MSKDKRVASCLEDAGLRPEQLTADWFIASEIHLGGPRERDLIVQPGGPIPGTPPGEVSQNFCLVGANTAQFWVLRKTPQGFALVVSQMAHDLKVLRTRTNGLRDIRLAAAVGGYYAALDYRFNGHSYEIAGRSSELTGAEIPHDLSGYETAKPFLQPRGQPSGPIRAKARAWIWQHWKTHRLSYLKVRTIDNASEETCTYFVHRSETNDWRVTLKVHRIRTVAGASPGSRREVVEDELLIAEHVQRIEPSINDSDSARVFSDSEELPEAKYKLRFLDYAQRTVGTL